jgi:hypothetical protein
MTEKSARNDIFGLVMLSEVKHLPICHAERSASIHAMDSSLSLGMTKKSARNDIFGLVMLNEVKHLPICHAERSEASISGFLTDARNDKKECSE